MMIIFILFFGCFPLHASVGSGVAYSRACSQAQCGNWKEAQEKMSTLVIDNPDCPELLYDNGVTAFRLQEFEKALAYFSDTTKNADSPVTLKKQAHFNLGNTHVALNDLPEAIKDYEAVLAIDPDDERAKHNLQKIAELLAQQKEQEQQQQNQNGNGEQEQQDQTNQSSKQQQSGKEGDTQQSQNQKSDSANDSSNGQQKDDQRGEQSHDQSSEQKEKSESNGNEQGDQENQANGESAGQDQDQQEDQFGNGHDSSPEGDQDDESNNGHNVASEQQKKQEQDIDQEEKENATIMQADDTELDKDRREQEQKQLQQKFAPNEQWMARLLQRSDKADEQANKQLIKATVDKNMAGKYGQNNW